MLLVFVTLCVCAAQVQGATSPQEAERIAEQEVKSRPSAQSWQRLGLARYLQSRFDTAIPAFEKATALDGSLWPSHLFLGVSLYRTNKFSDALESLQRARKLAPVDTQGSDDVDYWLGATWIALKHPWEGLKALENLQKRNPKHKDALALMARTYADLGGALWNDVAEHSFDSSVGQEIHGHALESEGNLVDAKRAYVQSRTADPHRPGSGLALAKLQLREGRTDEALSTLASASSPDPIEPELWFVRGLAFLQARNPAQALPYLQQASEWSRTDADVHLALAQVLLSLGKDTAALTTALKAAELEPSSQAARELVAATQASVSRGATTPASPQ